MVILLTSSLSQRVRNINQPLLSRQGFKVLIVGIITAILVLRGGQRITHPQLWAEDGAVFFQDAYNFSFWQSVLTPYAGYFLVLPKLLAEIAMLFRLELVPLVFAISSLLITTACCSLFLFDSFSRLIPNLFLRAIFCVLLAALPASDELVLHLANIQWYLGIACMLLILMPMPQRLVTRAIYFLAWLLAIASAPIAIIFFPCLLIKAWIEQRGRIVLLMSSATIVVVVLLIIWLKITSPPTPSATLNPLVMLVALINVFAYQVLAAAILGGTGSQAMLTGHASIAYLLYIPFLICVSAVIISNWHGKRWNESLTLFFLCYCMVASITLALVGRPYLIQDAQIIGNSHGGERYYVLSLAALYLASICGVYRYLSGKRWFTPVTVLLCLLLLVPVRLDFITSQGQRLAMGC